jgi:hypothetical protein
MLAELYLKDTASNAKNKMKMFVIHSIIEIVPLVNICAPQCVSLRLCRSRVGVSILDRNPLGKLGLRFYF